MKVTTLVNSSTGPLIDGYFLLPSLGMAVLEVVIEQLTPRTCDVNGVVDALQKNHPSHLGPNMVSANQVSLKVQLEVLSRRGIII